MFYIDKDYESDLRMDFGKIVPFTNNWYDVLPSFFLYKLRLLPVAGLYVVTKEQYRPDLVSFSIYGDVQYKQLLMEYNSIISHLDIIIGLQLSYPSLADMEDIFYSLNAAQVTS